MFLNFSEVFCFFFFVGLLVFFPPGSWRQLGCGPWPSPSLCCGINNDSNVVQEAENRKTLVSLAITFFQVAIAARRFKVARKVLNKGQKVLISNVSRRQRGLTWTISHTEKGCLNELYMNKWIESQLLMVTVHIISTVRRCAIIYCFSPSFFLQFC